MIHSDPNKIIDDHFYEIHRDPITTHFNQDFKGPVLKWIPPDTKEAFKDNYEKYLHSEDTYRSGTVKYYKRYPLSYEINEVGFRDTSLDSKPKEIDLYLGCSFTFGIGVRLEDLWVEKLKKEVDFPSLNAGVPGSGVLTHYRLLIELSKRFKIRNVYHYFDHRHNRVEWYHENLTKPERSRFINCIPSDPIVTESHLENVFNSKNNAYIHHIAKHAMIGYCQENRINLYSIPAIDVHSFKYSKCLIKPEYEITTSKKDIGARDIMHLTLDYNHWVYLYVLKLLGKDIFLNKDNI